MAASDIEWTDATWNPIAGCRVLSPGCTNCYAMRMAARLEAMGVAKYRGTTRKSGRRAVWTGRIQADESVFDAPLRWKKPRMVFVNSMSDLFQENVPEGVVERVWNVMERAEQHQFQLLTKRPDRLASFLVRRGNPLSNVWIGTSVESEEFAGRIDEIRSLPAVVRFVSFEPLLGPAPDVNLRGIDWIIVGGESGPRARPMEPDWVAGLLAAARRYRVRFFFKQWGGPLKKRAGRELNGRTWDEFPVPRQLVKLRRAA